MAKLERTDKPVDVLLDELGKGELGLPEIQRGYVWNRPQARDLIDSLYREYPSGLVLLWRPEALPQMRDGHFQQSGERKMSYLILDGQQRLTSLKHVFDGDIAVYFNVEDEAFQIYSSKLKANPRWVSVKEVLSRGAIDILDELEEALELDRETRREYGQRLNRLHRIRDYRYPVMVIHTDDYEEVTESFIRINSRGTRLREAELAMAQLAFFWPGAIVKEFESALEEYSRANFDLEARFLMRCFVAVGTGQSRFKYLSSLWKKPLDELQDIWKRARRALDHTIAFLRNNAGIESSKWIPSVNAMVPLVTYFAHKTTPLTEAEANHLLFWYFEATVHGRFASSPETHIDQDIKALAKESPIAGMIGNLRRDLSRLDITPEMLEGKYQRHSFLPLMFVIFRQAGARDWFTGTVLSSTNVGPDHQVELHHIFPRAVLKKAEEHLPPGMESYLPAEIDDLANIAFLSQKANRKILDTPADQYLPDIDTERLRQQLVPTDPTHWTIDQYRHFLAARRERLCQAMNTYLRDLGGEFFLQDN